MSHAAPRAHAADAALGAPHLLSAVPASRAPAQSEATAPAQLEKPVRAPSGDASTAPASRGAELPARLRAGIEALSGVDLSDVQVHANSARPARLSALAYAQGQHIHLARGQEHHLPHEAWHLVQQRQGRVQARHSIAGVAIADDGALEREADQMGARALHVSQPELALADPIGPAPPLSAAAPAAAPPAQLVKQVRRSTGKVEEVADDYALKWGERFVDVPAPAPAPVPVNAAPVAAPAEVPQEPQAAPAAAAPVDHTAAERAAAERAAAERAAAERAAAERAAAERAVEERRRAREERERQVALYPHAVTRTDNNFASATNNRGQGKAHLLDTGLAPAGDTALRTVDQLVQDAPSKGSGNLISFTGPAPANPVAYGGPAAPQITLKTRKLVRAKLKGKADAQHIDVHTSADLRRHIADARRTLKKKSVLRSYVGKDDEHQVRVSGPASSIPRRFLHGAGVDESHDSDSDEDS